MAKRLGKPSLSEAEAQRVVDAMRRALKDLCGKNQAALARALGTSAASVSNILTGVNKPAIETARKLGEILHEDYRQWLDPPVGAPPMVGSAIAAEPGSAAPKAFFTRAEWQHLADEVTETLIRDQGCSAADVRQVLDAAISFNTRDGQPPDAAAVIKIAKLLIGELRGDSVKIRKRKHV